MSLLGEEYDVVHVFASLMRGGAEARTLEALQLLGPSGPSQTVLTVGLPGGALEPLFVATGVPVSYLRGRSWAFAPRYWKFLKVRGVRVIHSHLGPYSGPFLALGFLCGVPVRIAHFRSDGDARGKGLRSHLEDWFARRLIDLFATDIVGVSPGALTYGWRQDWPSDPRCRVLLSGLDLSRFSDLDYSQVLRSELSLHPDSQLIVHVGRDTPVKNRKRAIEILAEIRRDRPRSHLIFIGRNDPVAMGEYRKTIDRLGCHGHIHFLGDRNDVPQLLACAHLLLLTSLHEGLPGVVVEACAAGTPVLASDLPGTHYLSDRLPRIKLASLTQDNHAWSAAAGDLLDNPPTHKERRHQLQELHGSAFDLNVTMRHYLALWGERDGIHEAR